MHKSRSMDSFECLSINSSWIRAYGVPYFIIILIFYHLYSSLVGQGEFESRGSVRPYYSWKRFTKEELVLFQELPWVGRAQGKD